jgi:adenosylcobinamide-phosphate synthase
MAGVAIDQLAGDPRRGHPVAAFGAVAGRLEAAMWRDGRVAGVAYAGVLAGSAAALGVAAGRLAAPLGLPRAGLAWCGLPFLPAPKGPGSGALGSQAGRAAGAGLGLAAATSIATWAVLGGRTLAAEAAAVQALLDRGDLAAARTRLTHLVGRRTERLDEGEIARAAIESVAENTCDAVVAPLLWGAVAGLPGLLAYRAINTLDAMVGHHSPRYERFGWASARADDVANYLPARLTAVLTAAVAPLAGGSGRAALATCRRDGRRHPSPNAGVCESAYAGALGVRLGGRNDYGSCVEDRPVLGPGGRAAAAADVARAVRLSRAVTLAAAACCGALAAVGPLARVLAWLRR